jgi:primosomal protein N' (replication factor Y)
MICHYCGYSTAYTGKCSNCSGELNNLGAGTQKIEEEAAALFPDARIARLDSDTAQNKAFEAKTIKDFAKGDIDILIGTQIITKGFDFEKLNLVAVIAADTLLGIQDFRADEKAMQLLEQFRGRCGRREKKGMFVIQTSQPEHPIYQSIISSGEQDFCHTLLSERKDFDFPPYTRIIELTVKDTFEDRADRMSRKLSHELNGFTITGPYSPAVDKIADRHIRKIRISLKKDRSLALNKARLDEAVIRFEKSEKYEGHISIDVDPA